MSRERYNPADNQWLVYSDADWDAFAESVYSTVGDRFPMKIQETGEVVINFDTLPSGVTENDVKQAVKDNHPHR